MWFKRKPVIKVVSIQVVGRKIEESITATDYTHYMSSSKKTANREYIADITIVLLAKDGELMYREFNGVWDLEDIKKWEDL